jgi:hypothetical protein
MSCFSNVWSNDTEFSGERKRVRCNELLGRRDAEATETTRERRTGRPKWTSEAMHSYSGQKERVPGPK